MEDAVVVAWEEIRGEPVGVLVVCDGVTTSVGAGPAAALAAQTACAALLAEARGDGAGMLAMAAAIRAAHDALCAPPAAKAMAGAGAAVPTQPPTGPASTGEPAGHTPPPPLPPPAAGQPNHPAAPVAAGSEGPPPLTLRPAGEITAASVTRPDSFSASLRGLTPPTDTPAPAPAAGLVPEPAGLAGTTIVAAVYQEGIVTVGWVGDSRAYWVAGDDARLLTRDHTWLNELVDTGRLDEDSARRLPQAYSLTRCLGPLDSTARGEPPQPSVATFRPPPGALLLLCTDGLWNYAPAATDIASLILDRSPEAELAELAASLIGYALDCGGYDNIGVALARLP